MRLNAEGKVLEKYFSASLRAEESIFCFLGSDLIQLFVGQYSLLNSGRYIFLHRFSDIKSEEKTENIKTIKIVDDINIFRNIKPSCPEYVLGLKRNVQMKYERLQEIFL